MPIVASVLVVAGVIASFGLFDLAERVFHLGLDIIQTLIYFKLSIATRLSIFAPRTRSPFWTERPATWTERPATILLLGVLDTLILARLIAIYGLFRNPIGWTLARTGLAVWSGFW